MLSCKNLIVPLTSYSAEERPKEPSVISLLLSFDVIPTLGGRSGDISRWLPLGGEVRLGATKSSHFCFTCIYAVGHFTSMFLCVFYEFLKMCYFSKWAASKNLIKTFIQILLIIITGIIALFTEDFLCAKGLMSIPIESSQL